MAPDSSKAFFRRGLARKNLGKLERSINDLKSALDLEPQNSSIQTELDAVVTLLEAEAATPAKVKAEKTESDPATDRTSKLKAAVSSVNQPEDGLMTAVSSRRLPQTSSAVPAPSSFAAAKSARSSRLASIEPARLARSASPPLLPNQAQEPPSVKVITKARPSSMQALPKAPIKSAFEFHKTWSEAKLADDKNEALWLVLTRLIPNELREVFQASLEPDVVVEVLHVLDAG